MAEQKQKSWLERIGCQFSSWAADLSAHPFAQVAVVVICASWFLLGLKADILTAVLSILAITLSQMVLNRQNEREIDAHRRDVAMHAKLDELISASRHARNDLVGVEEREEHEIVQLKEEVKEAAERTGNSEETAEGDAARLVEAAAQVLKNSSEDHENDHPPPAGAAAKG